MTEKMMNFFIDLAALLTALGVMYAAYKKAVIMIQKIDDLQVEMSNRFEEVEKKIEKSDMEACQNFIVQCLAEFERGAKDEATEERFWKEYKYYKDHDGNGYIDAKVSKLEKEEKL